MLRAAERRLRACESILLPVRRALTNAGPVVDAIQPLWLAIAQRAPDLHARIAEFHAMVQVMPRGVWM
jgi:hypothetical protein